MTSRKKIGLAEARIIAEAEAVQFLSGAIELDSWPQILSKEVAEGATCWIFFRNKEIPILPGGDFFSSAAYAVSKTVEIRVVADFSDDPKKLEELLMLLSNFFEKRAT